MNENNALTQITNQEGFNESNNSLESIIDKFKRNLNEIFIDDYRLKEFSEVQGGKPILISGNAHSKGIKVKEAVVLYQDQSKIKHKLYIHEAIIVTPAYYLLDVKLDRLPHKFNPKTLSFLLESEYSRIEGNYEIDGVYYSKDHPLEIRTPVIIKAQKAELDFEASQLAKALYPGKNGQSISKLKNGVYELNDAVISIDEIKNPRFKYFWSPNTEGGMGWNVGPPILGWRNVGPPIIGSVMGGMSLFNNIRDEEMAHKVYIIGLSVLSASIISILNFGIYNLYIKNKNLKNLNLSFIGSISKEVGGK